MYFRAKIVTGYAMAAVTIALLYLAGTMLGVRLSAGSWLTMTGLILVGLVPFAVLGILLGHLLTVDSMGPAMGGITALFALLGGAWGPIAASGALHDIATMLPSYWLVQAGQSALDGEGWPPEGWIVIGVWTLVLTRMAVSVYRRDTSRGLSDPGAAVPGVDHRDGRDRRGGGRERNARWRGAMTSTRCCGATSPPPSPT